MSKPVTCRGCGAPIRFIRSAKGRMIPCDPPREVAYLVDAPGALPPGAPHRRVTLVTDGGQTVSGLLATAFVPTARPVDGFRAHFASCPKVKDFRRDRPQPLDEGPPPS